MAPTFLVPLIGILPAAAVILLDLSRFEGYFRHESMFFGLIAGFGMGFITVILEAIIFVQPHRVLIILAVPLVEMLALVVVAGLPRFRGDRAAVWYGAAAGLGMAALLSLGMAQRDLAAVASGATLVWFGMATTGLTLLLYAAGMLAGWGAFHNRMLVTVPAGYLLMLPPMFFRTELNIQNLADGTEVWAPFQGAGLWAVLLFLYGAGAAWGVARKGHEVGQDPEVRKEVRRQRRKEMRGGE